MIYWTAAWCGPCKQIGPEVEKLSTDNPTIDIAKIDIDELQSAAQTAQIASVPYVCVNFLSTKLTQLTSTRMAGMGLDLSLSLSRSRARASLALCTSVSHTLSSNTSRARALSLSLSPPSLSCFPLSLFLPSLSSYLLCFSFCSTFSFFNHGYFLGSFSGADKDKLYAFIAQTTAITEADIQSKVATDTAAETNSEVQIPVPDGRDNRADLDLWSDMI